MGDESVNRTAASGAFRPANILYYSAWIGTLFTLYVMAPVLGYDFDTWTQYYRSIGELTRIWGVLFGFVFFAVTCILILRSLLSHSVGELVLRLSGLERLLIVLFAANVLWGALGVLNGNPTTYVLGDTLKGLFIPVVYWIVKKSHRSLGSALSFTKIVLAGETLLLAVLVPTGFIPFSFAGRTFLSTLFFTLLFEEKNSAKRVWYIVGLGFAILVILTTSAVRGIIVIFLTIILLNYLYRLREMKFRVVIFAFILPAVGMLGVNEVFDLKLEKEVSVAAERFSGAVGERENTRYFGLDESLFQRVGEAIDVGRAFTTHSSLFMVTGFGNGAMLQNTLITPSEYTIFKSREKHQIYITPVAILFRYGLLGLALYGGIVVYLVRTLRFLRHNREALRDCPESVYLKLLLLYQVSVVMLSLISYWYVGNFIVAITLALAEILRSELVKVCRQNPHPERSRPTLEGA